MNNNSMQWMMRAMTKRARVARTMVTAMRVPGDKDGKGGKGHGVGHKGSVQQRGQGRQGRW
jgi:hypothetical protein